VFDHGWAEAWERAGGAYYPKLQVAVPFTPVPGPRLLGSRPQHLLAAIESVTVQNELSSAHITFADEPAAAEADRRGWLTRHGIQYHWFNRDYSSFDEFLGALSSRKRKAIRKERERAQAFGGEILALTGDDLQPEHWDAFWRFYQDTGARKWGHPYLTRAAFDLFGERMGEQILLLLAFDGVQPIAGALNFIGADALYGRYWGCLVDKPFLHFELCYYRAIEAAIERGLARVEAGAQGGHKLARGYEPVRTWSMHWIADPGFRAAVADFLERERLGVAQDQLLLGERTPFRKS